MIEELINEYFHKWDNENGDCHKCWTRYNNHKGYRCDSPLMITGWYWMFRLKLKWLLQDLGLKKRYYPC